MSADGRRMEDSDAYRLGVAREIIRELLEAIRDGNARFILLALRGADDFLAEEEAFDREARKAWEAFVADADRRLRALTHEEREALIRAGERTIPHMGTEITPDERDRISEDGP